MKTNKPAVTAAVRSALGLAAVAALVGCGGGNLALDGGGQGTAGASGATGSAGATGTGGSAGTGAVTGSACALGERTPDITDCTEFANTAASVTTERAVLGDGGIFLPGGELSTPAGGTLVDGDYELVRAVWGMSTTHTQRTIRLSASGTYTEWVIDQDDTQVAGGTIHYRINATWTVSGTTLTVTGYNCSGSLNSTFGYTATGDELDLFNFTSDGMFVYKRTCVRR